MRTLEEYLKEENLTQDHSIRTFSIPVNQGASRDVMIQIHPEGKNGTTMQFRVVGNQLLTTSDTKETK